MNSLLSPPPLTPEQAQAVEAAFVRFVTALYAGDEGSRARIDAIVAAAPKDANADLSEAA